MKSVPSFWRGLLATLVISAFVPAARADVVNVGNEEFKELMRQGIAVVDLRTAGEWRQTGVVRGSQLITLFDENGRADPLEWNRQLDRIVAADKPVILICRSGNRTGKAAEYLDKAARKGRIYNVKSGITGWMRDGLPVVSLQENIKQAGVACSPSC